MKKFSSNIRGNNDISSLDSVLVRKVVAPLSEVGTYSATISSAIITKTAYGHALKVTFSVNLEDDSTAEISRLFSFNWEADSFMTIFLTEMDCLPNSNEKLETEKLVGLNVTIRCEIAKSKKGDEYLCVSGVELVKEV